MFPQKESIVLELKMTDGIFRRYGEAVFRAADEDAQLTRMHHWIIHFLYDHGGEKIVCQRDVEREFHITRSSTSGLLKLMEKKGLIVRERVEGDARLKRLVLTEKAKDLHARHIDTHRALDAMVENAVSAEEKAELIRILTKLRAAVETDIRERGMEEFRQHD
ncbi:MAG: MarR family winged helix-turn-helix transcriptional regulator [Christensenellales bacterium]|jgi:MarR family transcriptional repressor of mepA